jgi:hypothetical protein
VTNEGAIALTKQLDARGSRKALVEEIKAAGLRADAGMVSRWCKGSLKPGSGLRLWLQERFGIPWQSWDASARVEAA